MVIEPSKGTIKARSEQPITMTFTFLKGGSIEELITCNVQDIDMPLGFLLKSNLVETVAETYGLSVSYELYDESALLAKTERMAKTGRDRLSALLPPSRYEGQGKAPGTQRKRVAVVQEDARDLTLKELNFLDARINKTVVKKFVMRNNSGIKAPFTIDAVNYQPAKYLDQDMLQSSMPISAQKPVSSSKHSLLEASEQSKVWGRM